MTMISLTERFRGALLGLAAGDALGTTVEFKAPGSFTPLSEIVGGGPFGLQAGQWTDDTSMALCLAESLLARNGFDAADQMARYVRWYRDGYWSSTGYCFDIGGTVSSALHAFERTGEQFSGSTHARSAGNGSLMRLAPVVLFYSDDPCAAIHYAGESSRTTHGAQTAVDACRYMAALLIEVLRGKPKALLLAPDLWPIAGCHEGADLAPEIAEIAAGSFRMRQPPQIRGSGYVVRSLEAALWAFFHSEDFRSGCLLAANLGDDADTTAAIYGQLAGAYYGEKQIPQSWRASLTRGDEIAQIAESLMPDSNDQSSAANNGE